MRRIRSLREAAPDLTQPHLGPGRKNICVLIVDGHPVVCVGLRVELGKLPDVEVVGEAGDGRCALRLVKSRAPDVVLMDISMSGLNGLEATAQIRDQFPKVKVLILSVHETEEYCCQALRAGASGYLVKSGTVAELPW